MHVITDAYFLHFFDFVNTYVANYYLCEVLDVQKITKLPHNNRYLGISYSKKSWKNMLYRRGHIQL